MAEEYLAKDAPAAYNQGIMDFGAMQCTPTSPNCLSCPLVETCLLCDTIK
ncbi:adenine DNA glycosylase [Prevotella disiens]|uniref:Adenine DNA glycosylase n=1 Tax=Prevotella disiens TaxID=28130 RepID=A0A379EG34_9BACT|nr:adenine DNA glycosylase [Prevotella disiens]